MIMGNGWEQKKLSSIRFPEVFIFGKMEKSNKKTKKLKLGIFGYYWRLR